MNLLLPFLALLAGVCLGSIGAWLVLKARIAEASAQAKAEVQPQLATLAERVASRDEQIVQLRATLGVQDNEKAQIAAQLRELASARTAAEEQCRHLAAQVETQRQALEGNKKSLAEERQKLANTAVELASSLARWEAECRAHAGLAQKHEAAETELNRLQSELLSLKRLNGESGEKARYLEERLGTERQEIERLQQRFQKEFEAVAHKLLVENSSRFGQQSAESLDKLLAPLKENLKAFNTKLEAVQHDTAAQSALLKDQVARIGAEAANLSKALKGDVKVLGNWGENMLDQILERSGLQLGVHYRRQSPAKDDAGERRFLDVVIDLPDDKHLVIDSKVSLKAYEQYVNCTDEDARGPHLEGHLESLRAHFRGLGAKRYHDTHGIAAPDFVLMYVPIEAAFFLAVGQEPELFSEALERNVVLITNSTLLATLRTVAHVWRLADQQKHALEIAERGGKLYDKFVGFITDLEGIGTALGNAQQVWAEASKKLHQGTGNLIGQVEKLRALGVKASKRLPASSTSDAEAENLTLLPEASEPKIPETAAN